MTTILLPWQHRPHKFDSTFWITSASTFASWLWDTTFSSTNGRFRVEDSEFTTPHRPQWVAASGCVWLEVNCGRRPVLHLSLPERPPSPLGPSPSWCVAVEGLDVGPRQLSLPFTPSCSLLWSSHLINSHCTSHWNFPFSIFCHSPRQPIPRVHRVPHVPRPSLCHHQHTASLTPTTRQVVP